MIYEYTKDNGLERSDIKDDEDLSVIIHCPEYEIGDINYGYFLQISKIVKDKYKNVNKFLFLGLLCLQETEMVIALKTELDMINFINEYSSIISNHFNDKHIREIKEVAYIYADIHNFGKFK